MKTKVHMINVPNAFIDKRDFLNYGKIFLFWLYMRFMTKMYLFHKEGISFIFYHSSHPVAHAFQLVSWTSLYSARWKYNQCCTTLETVHTLKKECEWNNICKYHYNISKEERNLLMVSFSSTGNKSLFAINICRYCFANMMIFIQI